ncbi:zinc finger protein 675-like isoform X11 [Leguminivora glycinivorella]|uniref:zinc finger protein 675-like isoform X11 n=1 Tax=Leguminivora glycinivorella TaxID=1035111 RepID=UPI00200D15FD|nr:zinc finger protein 675-like isoform X11 [Leguminivora glycinivorella]
MEGKSTDWVRGPSGPTVCRCCFAEGCYKDISTEYFWMGKKEVYCEMLTETFDLSIAFAQTSGPNSNSRLICEPCISRLRDASEFKKQVQECEKMFMQYLDPGRSTVEEIQLEITQEPMEKGVKLEPVKLEKNQSDDDFDDRGGFEDMDEDDLDDQPLTKLASKVPKKESVDLLDLLDNAKAEKRKSSTKAKASPAKKAKTKKETPKATVSKPKPEKKKKGRKGEDVQYKPESAVEVKQELAEAEDKDAASAAVKREEGERRRTNFRNNISTIIDTTTAYPFKYRRGMYLCYYCKHTFLEPEKLRQHNRIYHSESKVLPKPRKYEPVKMDFTTALCKLCLTEIRDYAMLKAHLTEHGKKIDNTFGDSVLPYKLSKDEHVCQVCGKTYEMFLSLHKHMNDHYEHYICEKCGKRFATAQRMLNHTRTHETGVFPCKQCDETFPSYAPLYTHVAKVHRFNKRYKCPICNEKFVSYKQRLKHLHTVHEQKTPVFPCPSCDRVFDLCSKRTAHIRFQHLQERNHICSVCGMKFFSNYELQEHAIKHGGERIYQCDVCKKAYARIKTLREHMRIHNNDRRYTCPVCGQSFIQNCSMKQHIRVHHPTHLKDVF